MMHLAIHSLLIGAQRSRRRAADKYLEFYAAIDPLSISESQRGDRALMKSRVFEITVDVECGLLKRS
jgi:hypothetical protein